MEELRLNRYPRWLDVLKLTLYGILENFGYRQLNTVWRAWAIVSFLRNNQSWGAMERRGFAKERRRRLSNEVLNEVMGGDLRLSGARG